MLGFAVASILEEISDSAAAKALVALSMWEDAQVEGASRPLATRSVAASTDGHGGGTPPLPAQASFSIKKQLLTRFESGVGDWRERRALAQGLAPLALRDAGVRSVLIAGLKAHTGLHTMSITTATWRVLRVDRLSQP